MTRFLPVIGTLCFCLLTILAVWFTYSAFTPNTTLQNSGQTVTLQQNDARNPLSLPVPRPDVFYAAITERPLFEPGRRPFVPDTEEKQAVVEAPVPEIEANIDTPDVLLLGVMQLGGQPSALLSVKEQEPVWYQTDAELSGWTLTNIQSTWIELTLDERQFRVDMYK